MTLNNEEKATMITQHIRNQDLLKYNIELSLIEENSVSVINTESVSSLTAQLSDCNKKLAALATELASVTE
jgi:hypothetical protein